MDGYSSGFRGADNGLSTSLMVPEVHIIKNQISKLSEAIQLPIGICGAGRGGEGERGGKFCQYLTSDHGRCFLLRPFQFIIHYSNNSSLRYGQRFLINYMH